MKKLLVLLLVCMVAIPAVAGDRKIPVEVEKTVITNEQTVNTLFLIPIIDKVTVLANDTHVCLQMYVANIPKLKLRITLLDGNGKTLKKIRTPYFGDLPLNIVDEDGTVAEYLKCWQFYTAKDVSKALVTYDMLD